MVLAAVGQTLGVMLGRHVRRGLLVVGPLRALDNVGGLLLGAVTGLVVCWVAGAALLYIPGQTELRRYAQDSTILSALNEELPPARVIDALSRVDPFSVIAGPAADVDPPDPAVLDSAGVNAAAFSVVRVVGDACGLGIEGSGWVAAARSRRHERARRRGRRLAARRPADGRPARRPRRLVRPHERRRRAPGAGAARQAARARRRGRRDAGRDARLSGERSVRRDAGAGGESRDDHRPRRLRQLPPQPAS